MYRGSLDTKFAECTYSARGTFSTIGLNAGGRKNVRFQWKTDHMSEKVKDRANVTINH